VVRKLSIGSVELQDILVLFALSDIHHFLSDDRVLIFVVCKKLVFSLILFVLVLYNLETQLSTLQLSLLFFESFLLDLPQDAIPEFAILLH
jgi:hypothetical protein